MPYPSGEYNTVVFAALETSFDESAIAVAGADGRPVYSVLSSQVELHAPYGGCVPELAARNHLADLPQLWRGIPAELTVSISCLGVTAGPGLPGCLLAGVNFARGLSRARKLPLYPLNHLSGHVFSPFIPDETETQPRLVYPHLALLVSGGHTELFLVRGLCELELLGQTLDDAVGELLDKVSAMLNLGYPGGATLERLAMQCPDITPEADYSGPCRLPVPMRSSRDLNFSYSGLKTAVFKQIRDAGEAGFFEPARDSLLACLFAVVAESLWIKVAAAARLHNVPLVTLSGGVAINGFIRRRFARECAAAGLRAAFPRPCHCLDNAEMMVWLLKLYVDAGIEPGSFDIDSNWNPGLDRGKVTAGG
jgi:N6-L-threonylcarbamoyladenine synthase